METLLKILKNLHPDVDFETEEHTYRMKAYYTDFFDFDGTNYWQCDAKPHVAGFTTIEVSSSVGRSVSPALRSPVCSASISTEISLNIFS